MIVWLASYPKSGNTLLRSILTSYFFSQNGDFNFELLNKIGQFPLSINLHSNLVAELHVLVEKKKTGK